MMLAGQRSIDRGSVSTPRPQDPIAIVGMAIQFPGAQNAAELWNILEKGLNMVSEVHTILSVTLSTKVFTQIPKARFNVLDYVDTPKAAKRFMKSRYGNFLDDPFAFDNAFFCVSPREARSMDPQQRLLLQSSYHALEDAGYVPNAAPCFNPATFGVFVGAATSDYVQNLKNDIDVYYTTGNLPAFLSGKLSYAFGFSGPSIVVDTACSSSVVAIQQASRALSAGDCNAAIAGGVSVITNPDMYMGLDRAHFLSPTGQCKPWDASADGYCRSEGCGMFVLKRLSDAVKENDRILGVIRAVEVNQSANAESITHPHVPTQINLFNKIFARAGVTALEVSVVEAHGTGTKAGDPTELESIRAVLANARASDDPLHVTSIKANIGHAEAASGAASLAKLILMFQNDVIPATISLKRLNPQIVPLHLDGTRIDTESCLWPKGQKKRLALLNNFGAAGSNAALLLEEPPELLTTPATLGNSVVLGLSCNSEEALVTLRTAYIRLLNDEVLDAPSLINIAYTSTARRQLYQYRVSVSGRSRRELVDKLENANFVDVEKPGKTIFVFSGQGSQYLGMGGDLYRTVAQFRRIVDECHAKLLSWNLPGVLHIILRDGMLVHLENIHNCSLQTAVFVLEYALACLWMSWGVNPDAVVGHSLGEYAALVVAQVLDLDDALRLVATRAQLIHENCAANKTGMLAVHMDCKSMISTLTHEPKYDGLSIACFNSPLDCVVAGKLVALHGLEGDLKRLGVFCKLLDIPYAYHTEAMSPMYNCLVNYASKIKFAPPAIPIYSNVHGTVIFTGDSSAFNAEYFSRQSVEPVLFENCVSEMSAIDGFKSNLRWIEIGSHPTTLPMLRSSSQSQSHVFLPSLRRNVGGNHTLVASLSELYCTSSIIDWRAVFADLAPGASLTQLPAYPFSTRNQYFVPFQEDTSCANPPPAIRPATHRDYSLLGTCLRMSSTLDETCAVFETPIGLLAAFIEGHKIGGRGLCPASLYTELASAAVHTVFTKLGDWQEGSTIALLNTSFSSALVYSEDIPTHIRTTVTLPANPSKLPGTFVISSSSTLSPSNEHVHCNGTFVKHISTSREKKLQEQEPVVKRRADSVLNDLNSETLRTRTVYDIIFPRIVSYASIYQSIRSITIHSNGIDSYAEMQIPDDSMSGEYFLYPVFVDTLVHMAGFVVNLSTGQHQAFICDCIDKVDILLDKIDLTVRHGLYCTIESVSETSASASVYATALGGVSKGRVVARVKSVRFRKLNLLSFTRTLSSHNAPALEQDRLRDWMNQQASRSPFVPSLTDMTLVDDSPRPSPASSQSLMATLRKTVAVTLEIPVSAVQDETPLNLLGFDSLTSIEVLQALRSVLDIDLPENSLHACGCLRDIFETITSNILPQTLPMFLQSASTPSDVSSSGLGDFTNMISTSNVTHKTKTILASVLGVPIGAFSDNEKLERLGLDSLTMIEAHHELQREFNTRLPVELLRESNTLHELQKNICFALTMRRSSTPTPSLPLIWDWNEANPVRLQYGDRNVPPLFLIHDGSGLTTSYARLGSLGCNVYGVHNPRFSTGNPWEGGILEMASSYAVMITDLGCESCFVGGWSIGGVIAYEVACRLIKAGKHVIGLILIDSPSPETTEVLPDVLIDTVSRRRALEPRPSEQLCIQLKLSTQALVQYDHRSSPVNDASAPRAVMLRCSEGVDVPHAASSSSISWLTDRRIPSSVVAPWETTLGFAVPIVDVGGDHFSAFDEEHIPRMSAALKEAMELLSNT
ncbi:unnamed protein product [Somion occarium]|uniref:Polyketide synthase n=2 Tax=Somion occarium TaxID=3059160 RepID=A0ABP1DVQ1_9APHY